VKIGDLVRNIRLADLGPNLPPFVGKLLDPMNRSFQNIVQALRSLSISDNMQVDVVQATFSHGVPQIVNLSKVKNAQGAWILGCDGGLPEGPPLVRMNAAGTCEVIVFFNNPATVGATVTLVMSPEGNATRSIPAFYQGVPPGYSNGQFLGVSGGSPAWVAGGGFDGGPLIAKPASPDAMDIEFEGALSPWTFNGTTNDGEVQPYTTISVGGHYRWSLNSKRSSWLGVQVCNNGANQTLVHGSITVQTQDFFYLRFCTFDRLPYQGWGTNEAFVEMYVNDSGANYAGINHHAGSFNWFTNTNTANTGGPIAPPTTFIPYDVLALHHNAGAWNYWVGSSYTKQWAWLGSLTKAMTGVGFIAINFQNNANANPGTSSVWLDYVRRRQNTLDLP
jgi:hypothetical protein